MQPITDTLIVVSDIHLKSEDDERGKKLLLLLDRLDPHSVKHLVLLGDIFDFCFGASPYFKKKFARIGEKLSALSRQGVRVLFFQGNHEFSIQGLAWEGVEFVTQKDQMININPETSIAFTHGDRVAAPWHYHLYLRITRSNLFRILALLVPPLFLDRLALKISSYSRESSRYKRLDSKKILRSIETWLIASKCRHGVVGHFHIPFNADSPKTSGRILSLDSWDKPSFLAFDGKVFTRHYI